MKHAIIALALATAALSFAGQARAAYTPPPPDTTTNAAIVSVDKTPGFVTCGGGNGLSAYSLACRDYKNDRMIPYKALPGYRLGAKLPASYRVTAISYDARNDIATVYFEY